MTDVDEIQVVTEERSGALILTPQGEIDLSRSPSLRVHLAEAMGTGPKRFIINLSEVPYMDSSGVATFVEAMQNAHKIQCALVLCGLQDRVRSIFEIARLDMVFTIVQDTEAALKA